MRPWRRRRVMPRRRLIPYRIRTHPVTRVLCVALVVLVAVSYGQRVVARAEGARHRWGDERTVVVATATIAIGQVITADDVRIDVWPAGVVPDGAATDVVGRTATAAIERGEAVVAARLAPHGLTGIAALVPPGSRAIAVPVGPKVVALQVGDRVDLIAGFDVGATEAGQAPTITVARGATVVAIDEDRVTVAVDEADVSRVAFAIITGTVVPALRSS
jgi:Flp pilus assembly protein CpaB